MDTKTILLELRTQKGLSQDELAEKIFVSRQAVSRWENSETIPNTETRKAQGALVPCRTRSIGIWRDKSMANALGYIHSYITYKLWKEG